MVPRLRRPAPALAQRGHAGQRDRDARRRPAGRRVARRRRPGRRRTTAPTATSFPSATSARPQSTLARLAADPELRRRMGEQGRERVLARYRVPRLVEDVDRLYRALLAAKGLPVAAGGRAPTVNRVSAMQPDLTILMPVFNERATIEAAIADALGAELPVAARQLVIIDDGSTDGTREWLAQASLPDEVELVLHAKNRGKGAAIRTGLEHADGHVLGHPRRRPRIRGGRPRPRAGAAARGQGPRRLRHARLDVAVVVQLLVRDGQQVGHDGHERALQLLDLGRDDLPQGDEHRALSLAQAPRARIRDRAGDRGAGVAVGRADLRGSDRLRGPLTR